MYIQRTILCDPAESERKTEIMFLRVLNALPKRSTPIRRVSVPIIRKSRRPLPHFPSSAPVASNGFTRLRSLLKKNPVLTAGTAVSLRYMIGDAMVQLMSDDAKDADFKYNFPRTFLFGVFGFSFASTIGYQVYNVLYPMTRWSPLTTAVIDVFVQMPLFYFPIFYVSKEFIFSDSKQWLSRPGDVIQRGLDEYKTNFLADVAMGAKFWIPAHYVNFRCSPLYLRQPFMGLIGFLWAVLLSQSRGDSVVVAQTHDCNNDQHVPANIDDQVIITPAPTTVVV